MTKTILSRIKHIKVFFKDPDKKGILRIIKEVIHFALLKKTVPADYFRKFLYRKDVKDYTSYLSIKEHYSIIESSKMVFSEISEMLSNKLFFKLIAEKQNLPSPKLISYNIKNRFVFETKNQLIQNHGDLINFFKNLFKQSNTDKIFLKPIDGIGGFGCILLKEETLELQINEHGTYLLNKSYIHEVCIEQHQLINAIHPHSVNTLRIVNYIDKHQTIHILSTFMRFGVGKAITDNTSSGGFSISVNGNTGTLEGKGRQEITRGAGTFTKHPDTGYVLEGFQVPYFKEACDLVKTYAAFFPNRIVGWDVAITEDGPVMIEGNHNPGLHVSDIAYGGYKKHPLINDMLNEIKS